jgi:hypothetical protein
MPGLCPTWAKVDPQPPELLQKNFYRRQSINQDETRSSLFAIFCVSAQFFKFHMGYIETVISTYSS